MLNCNSIPRKIYNRIRYTSIISKPLFRVSGLDSDSTNRKIAYSIADDKPFFVGRLGSIEAGIIEKAFLQAKYAGVNFPLKNLMFFLHGHLTEFDSCDFFPFENNAGFINADDHNIQKFYELMLKSLEQVDLLGSWRHEEARFSSHLKKSKFTRLRNLEPYFYADPWSLALQSKKVVVVHPFAESISKQYKFKDFLFPLKVLPDFDLRTVKAIQSIGATESSNKSQWFDNLDIMFEEVYREPFDIALVGCGAYGFPLSARIKESGGKVIHLGGSLQNLFGIKGRRWYENPDFSWLINEYWTSPLPSERPDNSETVENGCYW